MISHPNYTIVVSGEQGGPSKGRETATEGTASGWGSQSTRSIYPLGSPSFTGAVRGAPKQLQ